MYHNKREAQFERLFELNQHGEKRLSKAVLIMRLG